MIAATAVTERDVNAGKEASGRTSAAAAPSRSATADNVGGCEELSSGVGKSAVTSTATPFAVGELVRRSDSPRLAIVTAKSSNKKIGDAATTYAAQVSCPRSCAFLDGGGCYAENGRMYTSTTGPLNEAAAIARATPVDVAHAEADAIDALDVTPGRPMRLHTVGDCSTDETALIVSAAAERYMERGGGPVWTYTHAWRTVARESWGRVSVLASCETPIDLALARARGYAPSIVVDAFPDRRRYELDGAELLPCPAQTTRDVACSGCRLCFNDVALLERGYAIAFAVHGTALSVKKALLSLADPTDQSRKLTSRDHALRLLTTLGRWPTTRELQDAAAVNWASAREMLERLQAEADDIDAAFAALEAS